MAKTETQINELKINYLTEAQYEEALANNQINDNEIYMTPASENIGGGGTSDGNTTYSLSKSGSTITLTGSDGSTSSVTDSNTTYTLPTASSSTLGGVKTTSSVTSTSGLTACPIINGVPYYKNTTYGNATTSSAGLMSASDKSKLDGLGSGSGTTSTTTGSKIYYGTCSSNASYTSKTVYTTSNDFVLETGARISVKFTNHNQTYDATLNVDSTGDKPIYWRGLLLEENQFWEAGAVIDFVYDGSVWEIIGIVNPVAPFSYVSGSKQFSLSSGEKSETISYGVTFESAPVVMLTIQDGTVTSATDVVARLDGSPKVDNFVVNVKSISNASLTGFYVNWVAIGTIAS